MEGARADLEVVGLQDDAALARPEILQAEYQSLEAGVRIGVGHCCSAVGAPLDAAPRNAPHLSGGPTPNQAKGSARKTGRRPGRPPLPAASRSGPAAAAAGAAGPHVGAAGRARSEEHTSE